MVKRFMELMTSLLFFKERRRFIKAIEEREKALRRRNGTISKMHHQRFELRKKLERVEAELAARKESDHLAPKESRLDALTSDRSIDA